MSHDDWRQVDRADVYKAGVLAAHLERRDGRVRFRYDDQYRASGGRPVAWTLPVDADPVETTGGAVPAFFAGLLPEGRRLSILRRAVKTSSDDDLTLLLAVGRDTIGDVQVVPRGEVPRPAEPSVVVDDWSSVHFSELVERSVGSASTDFDRTALPGVQAKLSGQVRSLPVGRREERWILKLNPPEYPFVVENEAFFLDAARNAGLATVDAEVVRDARGDPALLVRRFDRVVGPDGVVASLAQEDACQVLGLYPADKYQVSAEAAVTALVACTRSAPVASRDLFRQLVFAYLTGDGDVHAKNLSVGETPTGEWQVTPAYDLPSTRPYGDTTMALRMGGRNDGLTGRALIEFAARVGLAERAARKVVDELCDAADTWIPRLGELPFDARRVRDLERLVWHRRRELRRR